SRTRFRPASGRARRGPRSPAHRRGPPDRRPCPRDAMSAGDWRRRRAGSRIAPRARRTALDLVSPAFEELRDLVPRLEPPQRERRPRAVAHADPESRLADRREGVLVRLIVSQIDRERPGLRQADELADGRSFVVAARAKLQAPVDARAAQLRRERALAPDPIAFRLDLRSL